MVFTSEAVVEALVKKGLAVEFWYTGGGCHTAYVARPEMLQGRELRAGELLDPTGLQDAGVRDAPEVIAIGPTFEDPERPDGSWELYVGPEESDEIDDALVVEEGWDLERLVAEVDGMLTKA